MARKGGVLGKLVQDRALARWTDAARNALRTDLAQLRGQREQATRLRAQLDLFLNRAETRLLMPAGSSRTLRRPPGSDWAWRPQLWHAVWPYAARAPLPNGTRIGTETTVFHDATLAEIALRQLPNLRESDLAAYRIDIDVLGFDGGFLSLVLDLPEDGVAGLSRDHILQVDLSLETEHPLDVFVRLNVQHGPNTEQKTLESPRGQAETSLEFDMAYTDLNEKQVEKAWIDLIFESPEMNRIAVRDITLSRRLRAAL